METRRSKRKEAAASDPTPSEPRNKKARRANAEGKSKAGANRKQKSQSAAGSAPAEPSFAQAAEGAVQKASLDSAPAVAPSVGAEASIATAQQPSVDNPEEKAAENLMASRKELSEAQERAALEQERRAAELFGTAQAAGLGGLFGRFGESMAGPLSSSALKGIMASLKEDDEVVQEAALNELTELMSMSSEEALSVLPLEQLVPQLILLLNAEHNSQLMLLGARNLTLLADVLPTICSSIVRHGAVPALCARLMTIEYIDLAEQSLQALEKISHEHPAACLRHGGLLASLSYLDFFQTGVQRVAVATAANMCRCVSTEHTEAVASAIPMLTNLLQYQDAKVVDNACLALSRIAEAFAHKPANLNMLCEHGLITTALQLISVSETGSMTSQLSVTTYYGLIKLLSTCVSGSHTVAEDLLQSGISNTLHKLLRSSSLLSTASASSVLRSSDQLLEVVKLACELLPSLPDAATTMLNNTTTATEMAKECEAVEESGNASGKEGCLQARYLQENPIILKNFTTDLLPLLLQIYGSTVAEKVRSQCLATITKILHFGTASNLGEQLHDLPISSFIAALLAQKDSNIAAKAMQLAEIMMHKLPKVFSKYFLKEGVVHAVEQLAATAPKPAVEEQEKLKGKAAKRASQRLKQSKDKDKEEAKNAGKEPAAASDKVTDAEQPTPATPSSPKPTPAQTLQVATALHAQRFYKQYFSAANSPSGAQTDGMRQLSNICTQLSTPGKVQELLSILQDSEVANISTFEFLTSGAVQQLKDYLTGTDLLKGKGKAYVDSHKLLQRLHAFCEAATSQGRNGVAPMHSLVSKLQSVFASAEAFQVSEAAPPRASGLRFASGHPYGALRGYRSSSSTGDGSSLSSGLAALTQPFKLRLARAEHEKQLKDYSHNVVLIEPLASMTAVEDFLWSKVYRSSASPPPSSRAASGADEAQPAAAASHATNMATQPAATAAAAVAASDAHKALSSSNAASTATAKPNTRSSNRQAPGKSKSQEIPKGKTTANQRMTRAAAARVAAELADTAPGSVMEEDSEDEDMAEGPLSDSSLPADVDPGHLDPLGGSEAAATALGSSLDSAEQSLEDQGEEYDEEMDEEMDAEDKDEEEELAMRQPAVHDVHVGTESAEPSGASGRERAAAAARRGLAAYVNRAVSAAATAAAVARAAEPPLTHSIAQPTEEPTLSRNSAAASTSYAQATDATRAGQTKLRFYLAGKLVPASYTIFQAVQLASQAKQAQEEAQRSSGQAEGDAAATSRPMRRLWDDVYTISYSRYENLEEGAQPADSAASGLAQLTISSTPAHSRDPFRESPLAELLFPALPQPMQAPSQVQDVLLVLKILEGLNRNGSHVAAYEDGLKGRTDANKKLTKHHQVAREEFISHKLAPKLAQQLKDVLAICGNALPSWCSQLVFSCKFLFPFDIRRRYFYCTSFSLARALHHLQQQQNAEGGNAPSSDREVRELRVGRLQRQKVRVSRKNMLLSAEKVMETYASHRAVLELEYFGEVGTGLGPTLEFYTLLSHELQRRGLGMWRADNSNNSEAAASQGTPKKPSAAEADIKASNPDQPSVTGLQADIALDGQLQQFVTAPQGLFPAPIAPILLTGQGSKNKVLGYFKLMGRAMAKALQDNRLLDLPLSYVFYRKALGQPLDLYDIRKFDAALGGTLEKLYAAHRAHQSSGAAKKGPLLVDGCPIEDLCLTFVLPGYPEYELRKGGMDTVVDASNVGAYIAAVVDANLESGIKLQLEHFRAGFNEVFPLDSLKCFFEDEIEAMMCGTGEKWTVNALTDTIKFDHGYTASSTAIRYFMDILTDLDAADQRRFLRFVTGSPRLPPGGIAALHPRLTVVRKHSSLTAEQAASLGSSASPMAGSLGHQGSTSTLSDGDLPSVMTCANYVKLPPYSSKAVMRERVLFAIREGQGSFDLS